jgi:hypothetical protein
MAPASYAALSLAVDSRFERDPFGIRSNIRLIMDTWLFYAVVIGLVVAREFSSKIFFILLIIAFIWMIQGDNFLFSSWNVIPRSASSFVAPFYDAINNN